MPGKTQGPGKADPLAMVSAIACRLVDRIESLRNAVTGVDYEPGQPVGEGYTDTMPPRCLKYLRAIRRFGDMGEDLWNGGLGKEIEDANKAVNTVLAQFMEKQGYTAHGVTFQIAAKLCILEQHKMYGQIAQFLAKQPAHEPESLRLLIKRENERAYEKRDGKPNSRKGGGKTNLGQTKHGKKFREIVRLANNGCTPAQIEEEVGGGMDAIYQTLFRARNEGLLMKNPDTV